MLHPLQARRPQRQRRSFEPVSWDEALDDIAARLGAIAAREPEAILPYSYAGTMGLVQGESMAARFFHQPRRLAARPHDLLHRRAAAPHRTYGGKLGMHLEFFAESQLILIWGSNSIASNLHFWRWRSRPSAPAPGSSASTRATPRRRKNATSTLPCCPAPTARWRWR